ncbi:hypothetical protein FTW19_09660 [Terriglobus albidus]|uniref:Beta-glucuronidase C-terminal domain-containing protein n=1 Tax=Terriglobus albidus TaxID=1592106 RepID=A0A5B9ECW6_9BACT|nr:hypothetical protein [Terriglobus albidus]QEE28241.1 hypothetical protein FTW19_09660 [Terriglobus albidus]
MLRRRDLLIGLGATLHPRLWSQSNAREASISVDWRSEGHKIPSDYSGFSYESAQLVNPAFFSPHHRQLISLYRELTPHGVLRIGGGTSAFTTFTGKPQQTPPPFDVFGPDTEKTVKKEFPISTTAIDALCGFLDATGWTCIYGLNMAQGSVENAIAEATYVQKTIGAKLICFQLGNEPDSWRTRYRPAAWGPADFLEEWKRFREALVDKVPGLKLAGPDISNKLPYLTVFAEEMQRGHYPEVILLTAHYYAMGPARSEGATLDQLMSPISKQRTGDVNKIMAAVKPAGLPFRMAEGNSCWDGGKLGVSDTLASALWCGDFMLQWAQAGCSGVNLHGGGDGNYTPIAGGLSKPLTRRPEFYGMLLAQRFVDATLVPCTLTCDSDRVTAYAAKDAQGESMLAVFNKTADSLRVRTENPWNKGVLLTGPEFESKEGITLHPMHTGKTSTLDLPAHSAGVVWKR